MNELFCDELLISVPHRLKRSQRRALQRVFIDNAPGMLEDCQAIPAEHPADAILSEPLFGIGKFPMRGPFGPLRNRVLNAVHRRVLFAPVSERYEQAREGVGLPRLGSSFIDTLIGPSLPAVDRALARVPAE